MRPHMLTTVDCCTVHRKECMIIKAVIKHCMNNHLEHLSMELTKR